MYVIDWTETEGPLSADGELLLPHFSAFEKRFFLFAEDDISVDFTRT